MLPKKNRADKKTIEKLFKHGKFLNSSSLSFKFLREKNFSGPHISFIAPKSVAKTATVRNRLRRQGYAMLQKHLNNFPTGVAGAFVFKKIPASISEIENEIKTILNKIN